MEPSTRSHHFLVCAALSHAGFYTWIKKINKKFLTCGTTWQKSQPPVYKAKTHFSHWDGPLGLAASWGSLAGGPLLMELEPNRSPGWERQLPLLHAVSLSSSLGLAAVPLTC